MSLPRYCALAVLFIVMPGCVSITSVCNGEGERIGVTISIGPHIVNRCEPAGAVKE